MDRLHEALIFFIFDMKHGYIFKLKIAVVQKDAKVSYTRDISHLKIIVLAIS